MIEFILFRTNPNLNQFIDNGLVGWRIGVTFVFDHSIFLFLDFIFESYFFNCQTNLREIVIIFYSLRVDGRCFLNID